MNNTSINAKPKGLVTRLYFFKATLAILKRLCLKLHSQDGAIVHHETVSKQAYDQYGDRELREYEHGICRALKQGRLKKIPYTEVRNAYLVPVCEMIDGMLQEDRALPVKILEVGCGNATNLMLLKEKYGDKVDLSGIDISQDRIESGKKYWGDKLNSIELLAASGTDLHMYKDRQFDIVFTVCALEQMTYRLHDAVREMVRLARSAIVCVEPVFEFGNATQRLYNIVNDQCRTLLKELKQTDFDIEEQGLLPVLHNPLNPVGVVLGRKKET